MCVRWDEKKVKRDFFSCLLHDVMWVRLLIFFLYLCTSQPYTLKRFSSLFYRKQQQLIHAHMPKNFFLWVSFALSLFLFLSILRNPTVIPALLQCLFSHLFIYFFDSQEIGLSTFRFGSCSDLKSHHQPTLHSSPIFLNAVKALLYIQYSDDVFVNEWWKDSLLFC
jgi:hypothetical protein